MSIYRWWIGCTLNTVRCIMSVCRWVVSWTLQTVRVSCLSSGEWLVRHYRLSGGSRLSAGDWLVGYYRLPGVSWMSSGCMEITRDCQGIIPSSYDWIWCTLQTVSVTLSVHSVNIRDTTVIIFQDPSNSNRMYPISFLCPNGTIFNQEIFTCEWW